MRLFRRNESLHERLAREGGLVESAGKPPWDSSGIHGLAQPRQWDVVAVVDAPELDVAQLELVALPTGELLVEAEAPEEILTSFAQAIESRLQPPYRAEAVRRSDGTWAIGARAIEVVELDLAVDGEEVTVTRRGAERRLEVDGAHAFGTLPELEELAERRHEDYVLQARHLDGRFWEIRVTPL